MREWNRDDATVATSNLCMASRGAGERICLEFGSWDFGPCRAKPGCPSRRSRAPPRRVWVPTPTPGLPPNFAGSAPSPFTHPLTPISGFPFPYFADPRVPLASRLRERFLQKIGSTPTLHTVRRRQNCRPTKNLHPTPNFLYFGEKYRPSRKISCRSVVWAASNPVR